MYLINSSCVNCGVRRLNYCFELKDRTNKGIILNLLHYIYTGTYNVAIQRDFISPTDFQFGLKFNRVVSLANPYIRFRDSLKSCYDHTAYSIANEAFYSTALVYIILYIVIKRHDYHHWHVLGIGTARV